MRAGIVATAATLTAIGISSPRVAGRAGQLLLIAIGLIVVVVAVQPVLAAIEHRRAEPFLPTPPHAPRETMPHQMAEIVDAFTKRAGTGAADVLPPQLIRRLTTAATGRLVDHHHLHLSDADDHAAITRLVSPALWELLRPLGPATTPVPSPPAVPFAQLDPLLDEVERL